MRPRELRGTFYRSDREAGGWGLIVAVGVLALLVVLAWSAWAGAAPNLVLVIPDDLGWSYAGYMGHPSVRTPHLDQLAQQGLVFDQAQVTWPACEQSLRALGRGLHNRDVNRQILQPVLSERLKARGYYTLEEGKWRDGRAAASVFDRVVGSIAAASRSEASMNRLLDAVRTAPRPFFLWWSPAIPHAPHTAPPALLALYPPGTDLGGIPLEYGEAGTRKYLAMVSWLDARIGQLRAVLPPDTILAVMSDNGAGIRRSKGHFTEAGMRSPLILHGPGITPQRRPDLAASIDLVPTFVQIAGAPDPGLPDARSLVPAFTGGPGPRALWFSNLVEGGEYAVRDEAGRKVYTTDRGVVTRVSDLVADPYETRDWRGTVFAQSAIADLGPLLEAWRLRR